MATLNLRKRLDWIKEKTPVFPAALLLAGFRSSFNRPRIMRGRSEALRPETAAEFSWPTTAAQDDSHDTPKEHLERWQHNESEAGDQLADNLSQASTPIDHLPAKSFASSESAQELKNVRSVSLGSAKCSKPSLRLCNALVSLDDMRIGMGISCDAQPEDEKIIPLLCDILEQTIRHNSTTASDSRSRTNKLSFEDYCANSAANFVKRILKYGCAGSSSSIIMGLIYLERFKDSVQLNRGARLKLTPKNFRPLLLVAIMTANKFCEDYGESNETWAQIGGISLEFLNSLELDFLFNIGFNLHVNPRDYRNFIREIVRYGWHQEEAVSSSVA